MNVYLNTLVLTNYNFRGMFPASVNTVPYPEGHDQQDSVTEKKRPQAMLTLPCGVCGAPAPDHKHFGGRQYNHRQYYKTYF